MQMNNDSGGGPQTRRNAVESIVFRPEGEGGGRRSLRFSAPPKNGEPRVHFYADTAAAAAAAARVPGVDHVKM